MPRDKHKVTHENIDEKFDGIQIERYTSHLSDPTHLQVSVCRYVRLQSPLTSAFSEIVIVSKQSAFARLFVVTYGAQGQIWPLIDPCRLRRTKTRA